MGSLASPTRIVNHSTACICRITSGSSCTHTHQPGTCACASTAMGPISCRGRWNQVEFACCTQHHASSPINLASEEGTHGPLQPKCTVLPLLLCACMLPSDESAQRTWRYLGTQDEPWHGSRRETRAHAGGCLHAFSSETSVDPRGRQNGCLGNACHHRHRRRYGRRRVATRTRRRRHHGVLITCWIAVCRMPEGQKAGRRGRPQPPVAER